MGVPPSRTPAEGEAEPLAVVGFSFEFPQDATSDDSFWQMLCEGRSASTDFPRDRLNIDAFYHPEEDRPSTIPLRGGHFVKENLGSFDAPFFSITPGEAACMDPQHRRMLETTYHALESAGIPIENCIGSNTSVYTGCFTNDYLSILQQDYDAEQRHAAMGIAPSMLANRLSWFFDFKGTSMNLDSACSSSLVALHLACQDLRSGSSSMAIVGGANLIYHPNFMKIMSDFKFLSKDSRCWSFDQRANGYARGEGSVAIVVKRLSDALRDGDTLRAIIRNTGSNQDGRTPGITQPSQEAQVNLIKRTYKHACVDMQPTRFFEAHATGTPVGDPVEASAIGEAFQQFRSPSSPLYIGAVKANIGHLEGASGLAGVVKAILVLEKGIIPPIAGFASLNEQIDAEKFGLHFPREPIPYPLAEIRRACVNSFGFGGTNAIAILDDALGYLKVHGLQGHYRTVETFRPSKRVSHQDTPNGYHGFDEHVNESHTPATNGEALSGLEHPPDTDHSIEQAGDNLTQLLVWSAPDEHSAKNLSQEYVKFLGAHRTDHRDTAYALAIRRSHFAWKSFIVVKNTQDPLGKGISPPVPIRAQMNDPQIAFVFTGQGAQYLGMGKQLLTSTVFRDSIKNCMEILGDLGCEWSLMDIIDGCTSHSLDVDLPEISQTVTTCLQIALSDLWESVGITPLMLLGHSSGEIAAAYASGALSKPSAVKVAYHRGRLSSRLATQQSGLGMMAVGISQEGIRPYLERLATLGSTIQLTVACINSPRSITLSGDGAQLNTLEAWLKDAHVFARKLRVPMAYHSFYMSPITNEYASALHHLEPGRWDTVPMISSVSGDIVSAETLRSKDYWVRNMCSAVEFKSAFSRLLTYVNMEKGQMLGGRIPPDYSHITHVLEIGPHGALQSPIRENIHASEGRNLTYVTSLVRDKDSRVSFLEAVGTLHCSGFSIDLLSANGLQERPRKMPPNLPQYPFNHTQTYWRESTLSRNFRFRQAARHELLGTRSLDWNPSVAQWRNVLRLEELPWLRDHQIGSTIVLPAAGMVSMATEGLKQLIDTSSLVGVHIRNISFAHAISFPPGVDKIESQVTLIESRNEPSSNKWYDLRVFVLESDKYIHCCSGKIRAVLDEEDRDRVLATGPWANSDVADDWMQHIDEVCQEHKNDIYNTPAGNEVRYGPAFQNLEQMRLGPGGEVRARINTEAWKKEWKRLTAPSFAVHPATLDGLAQPLLHVLLAQRPDELPTMVPVHVSNLWIDCKSEELHQGRIDVMGTCGFLGNGGHADMIAIAANHQSPLLSMQGLETTFIASTEPLHDGKQTPRRLCMQLSWKPDIFTMDDQQILDFCMEGRPKPHKDSVEEYQAIAAAIFCFIDDAIRFIDHAGDIRLPAHLKKYVDWMKYQHGRLVLGNSTVSWTSIRGLLDDPMARTLVNRQVKSSGVLGSFHVQIGEKIIQMLCGEIDPLAWMFEDSRADRYYEAMLANDHHAYPASRFIDLLSFKNPSMNILEVGAGTGGQTLRLLETMSQGGSCKWAQYDYTDISPSFFSHAHQKFRQFGNISFKVLDVSKDPVEQHFKPGTYDLVVASHVLHATNRLDQSLGHIRKLLKPDGRLLLFETTRPESVSMGFAFGLLHGWWSPLDHEQRSSHSPCLTVEQWDLVLKKNGFSGVDVDIPGHDDLRCRDTSILISTVHALHTKTPKFLSCVNMVVNEQAEVQCRVAAMIQQTLCRTLENVSCQVYTLARLAGSTVSGSSLTIFLREVDAVLLDSISEPDYRDLKSCLLQPSSILWVTRSSVAPTSDPRHYLADGLGRTLMSEDATRKFTSLNVDGEQDLVHISDIICTVSECLLISPVEDVETKYVADRGRLEVCRVSDSPEMNSTISEAILPRQVQERQLGLTPAKIHIRAPGHLHTLEWLEIGASDESVEGNLGDDDVTVEVKAIGLTLRDHFATEGLLNDKWLGTECAGIVRTAGCQSGFYPGDRVCLLASSAARSIITTKSNAIVSIPSHMSLAEGASLPTSMWLAYRALKSASLETGDTVLILQGTSSVGQMAIQLAQNINARVLATTSSDLKSKFLCDTFRLQPNDIFQTTDPVLVSKIIRSTQSTGVDVIIGALEGPISSLGVDFATCLAPCGRIVYIGSPKESDNYSTSMTSGAVTNISKSNIDMIELLRGRPVVACETFQRAMKTAFDRNFMAPQPRHIFQASAFQAALQTFQDTTQIGKRIIELAPDVKANVVNLKTKPKYTFMPDATYIIAGGFGGLGRVFAQWMVSRGARHLILLSRSGATTSAAKALVKKLEGQGVQVERPAVDLTDAKRTKQILQELTQQMPPIRGCIQATVALKDNLFPNMTYDDWSLGTNSKASTSWNLHTTLPAGLDFFVLISSLNGIIGGRAQANYAAGNAFKDALAHHRISQGEKAVSINLGLVVSSGIVAENDNLLASMRRLGHLMDIRQPELLALMEHYCNPSLPLLSPQEAQILVGLETPGAVRNKGIPLNHAIHRPLFRHMFRMDDGTLDTSVQRESLDHAEMLRRTTSDDQAGALITEWFRDRIAQVLGLQEVDVDIERPVSTYGIDSLVAIDLKNWFTREIGSEVQIFVLLGNTCIGEIARAAAKRSRFRSDGARGFYETG